MTHHLSTGDRWPHHYRGYELHTNAKGDVWWQVYNGTDRLQLEPIPDDVVEAILGQKRIGGSFRVTEGGSVVTRIDPDERGEEADDWESIYIGEIELDGELVPPDHPEYSVPLKPDGLDPGDLWTSVYDGAKYSFIGERFWWTEGATHLRHPFADPLPGELATQLRRLRPEGGSFQITPWGDVVTQIPPNMAPPDVRDQFNALPRVVRRILQMRRTRGNVELLPVYVGRLDDRPVELDEPRRLTDPLTEEEAASLEKWAASLDAYDESEELSSELHQIKRSFDFDPTDASGEGR